MHEQPREKAPERIVLHSVSARLALVAVFAALSVAGIVVGAALDVREALVTDMAASTARLASTSALVAHRTVDDADAALAEVAAAAAKPAPDCAAALADVLKRHPEYPEAAVLNADGSFKCYAPPTAGQHPPGDRVDVRRALAAQGLAVGDFQIGENEGAPTLAFAKTVPGGVGYVILDLRTLADGGIKGAVTTDGLAYGITDPRGVMLLREPEPDRWAGQPLPEKSLLEDMMARKQGASRLAGFDGVERLYAYATVPVGPTSALHVYLGIPTSVALGAVRAAALRAAALAFALTLVAIWAAYTLGDILLLRRTRKLVHAVRHVVMGEFESKDEMPHGLGELDELTGLFDVMTTRLREAYSRTDEKVKTRTVELEFNKGVAELEKARIEALLSSIGEGVVATDKDGKVIFVNQEAERATGWTAAELVGQQEAAAFIFQDDKGVTLASDKRPTQLALTTGKRAFLAAFPKPNFLVRKDKSTYPVQVTVAPVIHDEEIIGAVEVIRDITNEAEFDRRKSEFISIASHQLRSPLAATKWLSDMLRKGDLGALQPKQQEMADKLFEANERMVVLVNELLNVSRIDSGVTKPTAQPTDMGKLVAGVVTDTTPLLATKRQHFEFDPKPLPTVMVDPLLIREVLTNLISNASKYSHDDGAVTVTAETVDGELRIAVKDDGIGIPKADQSQLFKKFFRAENALKQSVQGTGLGLYFCKSVVELSGGRIWFESEEDKGTTFFFTLPLTAPVAAK